MDNKIIVDTLRVAYQYLGKAVADGELANCALPVEQVFKRVGMVLAELEGATHSGISEPLKTGVDLIAIERERQLSVEGWSAEHDTEHTEGQLAMAAACYAFDAVALPSISAKYFIHDNWPWSQKWWKPTPDNAIRQLVKAGALIAAEIDRRQRVNK